MSTTLSPLERDAMVAQFRSIEEQAPFRLLTLGDVKRLADVDTGDQAIVSLYLDLGPEARQDRKWATVLKSLARDAAASTEDRKWSRQLANEVSRIEDMVNQTLPDLGRGLALFASESLGLWHQIGLPLALPNRLILDSRPYLRPLFRVLDEHERFLIVLVDDQRARLFVSQLGFIVEVADLIEEGPDVDDVQGGWARMRLQRQRDAHSLWHAGAVAHATTLAMEHFGARWLLASGAADTLVDYRQQLPQAVASRLAGEFKVGLTASTSDIADAAAPMQSQVESREEIATVGRLSDTKPGQGGVWGLDDTLCALNEMRVKTLVVQHDYRAPGGICTDTGELTSNGTGLCQHCGEAVTPVTDVVELALELAYRQKAQLEMVRSADALERLATREPIGALLRY